MRECIYSLAFRLSPLASCLLPLAFRLSPLASCLSPLASCLLPFASCLLPLASCLKFDYFFGFAAVLAAKSVISSGVSGIKASRAKVVVSLPIPICTGLSLSSDISGVDNLES